MRHDRTLVTERLLLRPLAERDAAAFHEMTLGHDAMRFWSTGPHRSPAESEVLIARMLGGSERAWVLCPEPEGEAIGLIHYLGNDGAPGMGYLMHKDHWGKGLMSEAVQAALAYGFEELSLDRVELWIDSRNLRSRKVADRNGFICRGAFRQKYDRDRDSHEKLVFGLRAEEWRAGAGKSSSMPIRPYGLQPVLAVQDVGATAAFYRDVLDFRIGFLFGEPPTYGAVLLSEWMATGARIHLRKVMHMPQTDDIMLTIDVGPGIEALHARYRERGVVILSAPRHQPWQALEFEISDCNGYKLCFSTPA